MRTVLLRYGRGELMKKCGTLVDEGGFLPAEETQFFNQWLLWPECFPVLAINPQGISKTPGIQLIVFDPTGGFALAVGLSALRIERIKQHASFQELLDRHSLTRLDGKKNRAVSLELFPKLFPT